MIDFQGVDVAREAPPSPQVTAVVRCSSLGNRVRLKTNPASAHTVGRTRQPPALWWHLANATLHFEGCEMKLHTEYEGAEYKGAEYEGAEYEGAQDEASLRTVFGLPRSARRPLPRYRRRLQEAAAPAAAPAGAVAIGESDDEMPDWGIALIVVLCFCALHLCPQCKFRAGCADRVCFRGSET